jgi:sulfur relay (sulfurtransferase) DsrC/TusE family protein
LPPSHITKSTKLAPLVKHRAKALKSNLKLRSESEVMAYLIEFYNEFYPQMRMIQHEKFKKLAKEAQNEQLLDLKVSK